jgi:hypothetical protein
MQLHLKQVPIEFLKDGHTYKHIPSEKLYTGVTTIIGVRQKEFLKWWTVKEMYNFLKTNWDLKKKYTEEEKEKLLLDGKAAHTKKSKEALLSGKIAHDWIENYIGGKKLPLPKDENAKNAIKAFRSWELEHQVEWLASELVVCSEKHEFAGTIDAIAVVDGILTIVDFKTSSQISEDAFLQTAGYWIALDEMMNGEERPSQRLVLRIPKDGKEFEAMIVPTDLEFDKKTFLNLREVHRWNVYIQNHFQDANGKITNELQMQSRS